MNLNRQGKKTILFSLDDDSDQGWVERFVIVATEDIVPNYEIPESQYYSYKSPLPRMVSLFSNPDILLRLS